VNRVLSGVAKPVLKAVVVAMGVIGFGDLAFLWQSGANPTATEPRGKSFRSLEHTVFLSQHVTRHTPQAHATWGAFPSLCRRDMGSPCAVALESLPHYCELVNHPVWHRRESSMEGLYFVPTSPSTRPIDKTPVKIMSTGHRKGGYLGN
jgi:hypothetical protein